MSHNKINDISQAQINILKEEARKHTTKPHAPPYNQIDSHKWASKMEIKRSLSPKR